MGLPGINLVSPDDLYEANVLQLHFDATYTDTEDNLVASTVVIEVDTVNTFDSENKRSSTFYNVSSGTTCRMAVTLFDGTWYWRVQATNDSGTSISNTRSFTITHILKRCLYSIENVAKYGPDWPNKRIIYLYENIAKYGPDWSNKRALYDYENITDDPPFPTIERLSTTRAAKGSVITIYGSGFGAKAEADPDNIDRAARGYGGSVYLGEQLCNLIAWSWQQIIIQIPNDAESGAVKVALTVPDPPGVRYSNIIGLEVYEAESADDIGIELFVCDKNNPNTILCQLEGAKNKSFQVLLNNAGSGKFSISRYDVKGGNREYIADENLILCRLDGIDLFKWIIESRKPAYVDDNEQQMIEVSGRGVLALLERAVVYPEGMPYPSSLERSWSNVHGAAIFKQLVLEAQQRGCLPGVVLDWTADTDSLGNPFEDMTNISFHAGTPLSKVANKLSDGMGLFDFEMTSSLHLKLYKSKGTDKYDTVKYRPGQAILEHQNQSDSTKVTNALLVEGEGGSLIETSHPTSQTDWGRREGYLQARNIPNDWARLQDYGQMFLRSAAMVSWGIQGTVIKYIDSTGNKLKPFETFIPGDWIGWYIPPEGSDIAGFDGKVRVKGITCEEDNETGLITYVLELNNIMLEHDIRLAQLVERISMYTSDSVLSNPATESPVGISHNHTHGLILGLDQDDHPQYLNEARHANSPHDFLPRVSGLKKSGANVLTGEVTLAAGSNVALTQNDETKVITIGASGEGGGSAYPSPDDVPGSPSEYDYEFANDGSTEFPANWEWVNQVGQTYLEQYKSGTISLSTSDTVQFTGIEQSLTADTTWIYAAKLRMLSQQINYYETSLFLRDSSSGRAMSFGLDGRGACWKKWNSPTSWASEEGFTAIAGWPTGNWIYLKLQRKSATQYDFFVSHDGKSWIKFKSDVNVSSWLSAPDRIGFMGSISTNNTYGGFASCEWWRKLA